MLLEKLEAIKIRFDEISQHIADPDVMSDMKRYIKLNKEYKELNPLIKSYHDLANILGNIDSSKEILAKETDEELKEMAREELEFLNNRLPELEEEIKTLLIPKDPEDSKNAIVEIRAGTGGDEASIFAGDLSRMYLKFCESKGWKTSISNYSEGSVGGYKEFISRLKEKMFMVY
jgi:peptide chain release factor 1